MLSLSREGVKKLNAPLSGTYKSSCLAHSAFLFALQSKKKLSVVVADRSTTVPPGDDEGADEAVVVSWKRRGCCCCCCIPGKAGSFVGCNSSGRWGLPPSDEGKRPSLINYWRK